ncbi:head decoration protein [Gracilibacillus sp. YIM 98692]|uniref:head decoration protein n=1 Tax=Gracilibacillus sp. YIM 98692 TaxID=2663532 RepID=UPI0013D20D9A|nr:head decoration protein [Gracilibacillus sp. YIM 98692]
MPTLDTFDRDNLFAGGVQPVVTDSVTVASGENLTRGTVLGIVSASGEAVAVDSAQTDGSEKPFAILSEDVDATDAATPGAIYLTGEFNEDALTFGGSDTADDHKTALREIGIFLKTNQEA